MQPQSPHWAWTSQPTQGGPACRGYYDRLLPSLCLSICSSIQTRLRPEQMVIETSNVAKIFSSLMHSTNTPIKSKNRSKVEVTQVS